MKDWTIAYDIRIFRQSNLFAKMAVIPTLFILLCLVTETALMNCGVFLSRECKCLVSINGYELHCNRIGFAQLPDVESGYRQRLNVFRARGNFITELHDSDIEGFTQLRVLDLRTQKQRGSCVVSRLTKPTPITILGLCRVTVSTHVFSLFIVV